MNITRRNQILFFIIAIALGLIGYRGLTKSTTVQAGSPLAARLLAEKYVGLSQGVDPVHVNETPIIEANRATAKAEFGSNKECTVKMVRTEKEKENGWLVEAISCGSVK